MARSSVVGIERRVVERVTEVNLIWDVRDDGRIGCEMCVCVRLGRMCGRGGLFLSLCVCVCDRERFCRLQDRTASAQTRKGSEAGLQRMEITCENSAEAHDHGTELSKAIKCTKVSIG
jgi:hypothetical protein